mmetsp:Transcript_44418/g.102647  ORF Transcript_44418/g.102647 Transcript_44418/m.102647 type:complete len:276 (-) Transcript_44418:89-916(-)
MWAANAETRGERVQECRQMDWSMALSHSGCKQPGQSFPPASHCGICSSAQRLQHSSHATWPHSPLASRASWRLPHAGQLGPASDGAGAHTSVLPAMRPKRPTSRFMLVAKSDTAADRSQMCAHRSGSKREQQEGSWHCGWSLLCDRHSGSCSSARAIQQPSHAACPHSRLTSRVARSPQTAQVGGEAESSQSSTNGATVLFNRARVNSSAKVMRPGLRTRAQRKCTKGCGTHSEQPGPKQGTRRCHSAPASSASTFRSIQPLRHSLQAPWSHVDW